MVNLGGGLHPLSALYFYSETDSTISKTSALQRQHPAQPDTSLAISLRMIYLLALHSYDPEARKSCSSICPELYVRRGHVAL